MITVRDRSRIYFENFLRILDYTVVALVFLPFIPWVIALAFFGYRFSETFLLDFILFPWRSGIWLIVVAGFFAGMIEARGFLGSLFFEGKAKSLSFKSHLREYINKRRRILVFLLAYLIFAFLQYTIV